MNIDIVLLIVVTSGVTIGLGYLKAILSELKKLNEAK